VQQLVALAAEDERFPPHGGHDVLPQGFPVRDIPELSHLEQLEALPRELDAA
jgi:hypothetical protein